MCQHFLRLFVLSVIYCWHNVLDSFNLQKTCDLSQLSSFCQCGCNKTIYNNCHSNFTSHCPENCASIDLINANDCLESRNTPAMVRFGFCNVTIRRLPNISACVGLGPPSCNPTTCFEVPLLKNKTQDEGDDIKELLCASQCNVSSVRCNQVFQSSDHQLHLAHRFWNYVLGCINGSDDQRNKSGFKCEFNACVLSQTNLHDNVSQCCDDKNFKQQCHFQCLDKRLRLSIDQVCDKDKDCSEFLYDYLCLSSNKKESNKISSKKEMIKYHFLQVALWVIAFVVLSANSYIIVTKSLFLYNNTTIKCIRCQHIILLNISIADFFMGIYLIILALQSVRFSGEYGEQDALWKTSFFFSFIGSLAFAAGETSCFLMALLTVFRLHNICKPFETSNITTRPWKIAVVFIWCLTVSLATIPIIPTITLRNYFVHEVWVSNPFNSTGIWNVQSITSFAKQLALFRNKTVAKPIDSWTKANDFLTEHFSEYPILGEFGYYSATSVCLARIFVTFDAAVWLYSIIIISTNLIIFLIIAISYIFLYYSATKNRIDQRQLTDEDSLLRKRIFRIVISDFFCWIPVCIIAYMWLSDIEIKEVVHTISAIILLPINSAVNPFLYSSLPELIWGLIYRKRKP